jgi:hypothetical protein
MAHFFHLSPGILAGSPMESEKNREKSGTSPGRGQNKVGKRVGEIATCRNFINESFNINFLHNSLT